MLQTHRKPRRDVLEALGVRVAFLLDEAGRRVVEVSTLISPAQRFEYMTARRYAKWLRERERTLKKVVRAKIGG